MVFTFSNKMAKENFQALNQEKSKLEQALVEFSQSAKNLEKEVKEQKQEELKSSFTELEKKIGEYLENENDEQIQKLQKEIKELRNQYKEVFEETKQGTESIKSAIENEKYGTNELLTLNLLKGTLLELKMIHVFSHSDFNNYPELANLSPEKRMEYVFRKINTVLTRFYTRKLNISPDQNLPDHLTKVIIPATERFLMDILKQTGQETNVQFLNTISTISLENFGNLIQGINDFSKKFTIPFTQSKALLNFSDFISLPKNQEALSKLKNPYDFYEKVMQSDIWNNITQGKGKDGMIPLESVSWENFGLLDLDNETSEEVKEESLKEGILAVQEEIGNIQMVDSPETVKKILGVLDKSNNFFEKTNIMKDQLLDKMDTFGNTSQALKSTLGINIWKEIRNIPFIGGLINFVLGLIGFSGGIEGMEKAWKKRKIDRYLDETKKDYITDSYKNYVEKKNTEDNNAKDIINTYKLNIPDTNISKFDIDLPLLKEEISWKIEENPNLINLSTLSSIKTKKFNGTKYIEKFKENGEKKIRLKQNLSKEEREAFLDAYIETVLQYYGKGDNIKHIGDSDSLAFSLISGITLKKEDVIDGIEAQVFLPDQFYKTKEEDKSNNPDNSYGKNPTLSKKLSECILSGESQFKYDAVNKNDKGSVSLGLMQRHGQRAVNLLKKLREKDPTTFDNIMNDPLFTDLDKAGMSIWDEEQEVNFQTLMSKKPFQEVMNSILEEDSSRYIQTLKSRGISDDKAILTIGRIYNAGPKLAQNIIKKIQDNGKDINNYENIIEEFKETDYGKKYPLFDHKDSHGVMLADNIANYNNSGNNFA